MWPMDGQQGQVSLQPMNVPMYAAQPYGTSSQGMYSHAAAATTAAAGFDGWALAQAAQGYGTVNRYPSPHAHMVQPHLASPHAMAHPMLASPQHHVVQGHAMQAPGSPAVLMAWPSPHPVMASLQHQHTGSLTPVALPPSHMPDSSISWQRQHQHQHQMRVSDIYNPVTGGIYRAGQQQQHHHHHHHHHQQQQQLLQQQQSKGGPRPRRNIVLSTKPDAAAGLAAGDYSDAAVEEFARAVRRTPPSEQLDRRLLDDGLQHLDSRGLAALLKELAKAHHGKRAREVFDYLRSLPPDHVLAQLCDVFTYTAMVSLCVDQQELSRAFELVGEMRQRHVERNVHTYTALMNVAIKCGQLQRAQEVYNDLLREGCVPNVVTFNTLIDLYGKTGQWNEALRVIHQMNASNIKPVTRTYNTLMIACNTSGQWQEALNVYSEMVRTGHAPNTTTYNALISAYSKAGRLEKVMETYQEMLTTGCERSVITYSALISACEKAGQWQLALNLFSEMLKEKCDPNVITYNSLITACAQGAQWSKAAEVFQKMKSSGCRPDVVTYTALVTAYERGGQWVKALQAFQEMQQQGCRADAILYNTLLDVLWDTGIPWAQQRAAQLFRQAIDEGHFRLLPHPEARSLQQQQQLEAVASSSSPRSPAAAYGGSTAAAADSRSSAAAESAGPQDKLELGLQCISPGVAMLMLHCWFADLRDFVQQQQQEQVSCLPERVIVSTGRGRQRDHISAVLRDGTLALLTSWQSPFTVSSTDANSSSKVEASGQAVARWIVQDKMHQLLSPFAQQPSVSSSSNLSIELAAEVALEQRCKESYSAVKAFEDTHNLSVQNMGHSFTAARAGLVAALLEAGAALGVRDDVVHDAVLLMDRGMSASLKVQDDSYSSLVAVCLHLTIGAANLATPAPDLSLISSAVGCHGREGPQELAQELLSALQDDTSSMSALHCLKLYLERLGSAFKPDGSCEDRESIKDLFELACRAAMDKEFLNYRPTITAAAILYCDRLQKGLLPFWPSSLATLTGYSNARTAELAAAISGAQRLCKQHIQQKKGRPAGATALQQGSDMLAGGASCGQLATSSPSTVAVVSALPPAPLSAARAHLNSDEPVVQLLPQQQQQQQQQQQPALQDAEAPASLVLRQAPSAVSAAGGEVATGGASIEQVTKHMAQTAMTEA